ncbi:hypothetical protein [Streptomyces sp. NPDC088775]
MGDIIEVIELEADNMGDFDALAVCSGVVEDPIDRDEDEGGLVLEVPEA